MQKSHILAPFFWVFALATAVSPAMAASPAKSTIAFRSQRRPANTDHVTVRLEVGGETNYTSEGKPRREKMSVECNLEYFEKTLETPAGRDAAWRSVRDYQKVQADVKVGDGQFKPSLQPQHHLIAVEAAKPTALLFAPQGNPTRDELDAIDIQANSLLLDRLLPEKPVAVGDHWPHAAELMAAMLGLDEVAKTTVQSTLREVTPTVARFELGGQVEGTIYGVSTKIELRGRYRFDLRTQRIDWLGMLIKEERRGSFVDDGLDVVSRLQMIIAPAEEPASLAEAALAKVALKPTPELLLLAYESPGGGWRCTYDRRWYLHYDRPKTSVVKLRLVDRGTPAGQCILSSLPDRDPDKLVSLEEFQEDVRRALGKSFGEFVEASQSSNAANYRVYRVVVHGTASDIAMRWIYYLVADPHGRRVAFTFTVEQNLVERFADADKAMVQSLRFAEAWTTTRERRSSPSVLRNKKPPHLRNEGHGGIKLKLLADCDWMRRCETSEGQACFCTSHQGDLGSR